MKKGILLIKVVPSRHCWQHLAALNKLDPFVPWGWGWGWGGSLSAYWLQVPADLKSHAHIQVNFPEVFIHSFIYLFILKCLGFWERPLESRGHHVQVVWPKPLGAIIWEKPGWLILLGVQCEECHWRKMQGFQASPASYSSVLWWWGKLWKKELET